MVLCGILLTTPYIVYAADPQIPQQPVTTGHSEINDGPLSGDITVSLTPNLQTINGQLRCVGANATGVFPFKWQSRTMRVTIHWDAYDSQGTHYVGTYSGPDVVSMGRWIIERWVWILDFDHGEFWGYAYENGVLKASDYAAYTWHSNS